MTRDEVFPADLAEVSETFDRVTGLAVDQLLQTQDFQTYLERLRKSLPPLIEELFGGALDEQEKARLCHAIGRAVWTRCPDPALGFRARTLAKPERNQPCPCGSGRKYKRCCADAPADFTGPLPLLYQVVRDWPQRRFGEIGFRHLDPEEIAAVAHEWFDRGEQRRAMKFLEAFFDTVEKWDHRVEHAFDLLVRLYDELGHPRKMERLIERALASKDPAIRAVALQRRAALLMERGEDEAAWAAFRDAQRLVPDDPALAVLEVTFLAAEGRFEEARERAGFWKRRLERQGVDDLEELHDFLGRVAEDPIEAFEEGAETWSPATRLRDLLDETEGSRPGEQLVVVGGDEARLEPVKSLHRRFERWREAASEGLDPEEGTEPGGWLDLLEKEPRLLTTFEVLDDLGLSLQHLLFEEELRDLYLRLGERAVALLETLLSSSGGGKIRRLEWTWIENRPALRLIARHAEVLADTEPGRAAKLMAWLLELSPNDNLGMRIPLIHLYCGLDRIEQARALAERYPEDLPSMMYGEVLTWYLAGERNKALSMLADLYREYPRIADTLVAENPPEPEWSPYSVRIGGEDEAWLYRQQFSRYWEESGALKWLRSVHASLPTPRKRKS